MSAYAKRPAKKGSIKPHLTPVQNMPYNKQNIINLPFSEGVSGVMKRSSEYTG
jgi:hypothetical protein